MRERAAAIEALAAEDERAKPRLGHVPTPAMQLLQVANTGGLTSKEVPVCSG